MKLARERLGPYLWQYRQGLALGLGALILKDVFGAVLPLAIREGVDSLTAGFAFSKLLWFAGGMLALSVVKGVFQYWMRVRIIGVSRDIEYDLRNRLFAHLMTLDAGFFARYRTGDLMARATNDLNAVRMMLGPGLMYWVETSLTFVLVAGILLSIDWQLTLLALAPAPAVSFAVIFFGRRIHARFEKIQAMFSDISSRVQENLGGVRVVRAYVQEVAEQRQFERLNRAYIQQNLRLVKLSGLFMPVLETLIGTSFLVVLWAGGARLLAGEITLGTFLAFHVYMGMLAWPMIALGWVVNLMQRGSASLGRLDQILRERPTIAAPAEPVPMPAPCQGAIELDAVTVRYSTAPVDAGAGRITSGDGAIPASSAGQGAAREALRNVSLRIPAGTTAAVVGHTGSGKTTLVNLIPRLLDPASGRVLLDGIDVRRLDPAELRRQIAVVPQETFLFSASLAGNIAFGVEGASREAIREAAEMAGLGPDIEAFPQGLDTMVGERGITLSGGQKQRAAIARAVLRDPRILILDDALSSVDTLTEERILHQLAGLRKGRTTILISHRVSTVRDASRIFVLEHGRVAEEGTHEELVSRGGYYAELYQRQMLEEELSAI